MADLPVGQIRAKCVGWLERSDTHRVKTQAKQADGFRKRPTHPAGYARYARFTGGEFTEQPVQQFNNTSTLRLCAI